MIKSRKYLDYICRFRAVIFTLTIYVVRESYFVRFVRERDFTINIQNAEFILGGTPCKGVLLSPPNVILGGTPR